jgi:serine/threonine protein kinase
LIDDVGHALITDFSFARPIIRDKTTGIIKGRAAFIPPEKLKQGPEKFTVQGDIYSLGVIFWELTAGKPPFGEMNNLAVCMAVLKGEREKPVDGTQKWYQEMYTRCWTARPKDRPSIDLVVLFLILQGQYCISFPRSLDMATNIYSHTR